MRRRDHHVLLLALLLSGCRDPTQITLKIETDALCPDVSGTSISVGARDTLEATPATASTPVCDGGRIGTLVAVPSGDDSAEVAIKVALAAGGPLDDCLQPPYGDHCIVARRVLRYLPHRKLTMPITMSLDCRGKACTELTTCVDGECVDATVDPGNCTDDGAGCLPTGSASGGTGGGGSGGGAAGGAGAGCSLAALTRDPQKVTNGSEATRDIVIAVQTASCTFGVAWGEGSGAEDALCFEAFDRTGTSVATRHCDPLSSGGKVDQTDVAAFGTDRFLVAGWSTGPVGGDARLIEPGMSTIETISMPQQLDGRFAVSGNQVALVYRDGPTSLSYRTGAASSPLMLGPPTAITQPQGSSPAVAWLGSQLAIAVQSDNNVYTDVIDPGSDFQPNNVFVARTSPRFAVHAGALAMVTLGSTQSHFQELTGAGAKTSNSIGLNGSLERLEIAATDIGWLIAYIDDAGTWAVSYDSNFVVKGGASKVLDAFVANDIALATDGKQAMLVYSGAGSDDIFVRPFAVNLQGL